MIIHEFETIPEVDNDNYSKLGLIREIFSALEKDPRALATSGKKYPYGDLFDSLYDRPIKELKSMIKIHKKI